MYLEFDLKNPPPMKEEIKADKEVARIYLAAKLLLPPLVLAALTGFGAFLLFLVPLCLVWSKEELEQLKALLEQPREVSDKVFESVRDLVSRTTARSMLATASRLEHYCDSVQNEGRNLVLGEYKAVMEVVKRMEEELLKTEAVKPKAAAMAPVDPEAEAVADFVGKPSFGL